MCRKHALGRLCLTDAVRSERRANQGHQREQQEAQHGLHQKRIANKVNFFPNYGEMSHKNQTECYTVCMHV